MDTTHPLDLLAAQRELDRLERRAREALSQDMDAHMRLGHEYHMLADAVLATHGVELRPQD